MARRRRYRLSSCGFASPRLIYFFFSFTLSLLCFCFPFFSCQLWFISIVFLVYVRTAVETPRRCRFRSIVVSAKQRCDAESTRHTIESQILRIWRQRVETVKGKCSVTSFYYFRTSVFFFVCVCVSRDVPSRPVLNSSRRPCPKTQREVTKNKVEKNFLLNARQMIGKKATLKHH